MCSDSIIEFKDGSMHGVAPRWHVRVNQTEWQWLGYNDYIAPVNLYNMYIACLFY